VATDHRIKDSYVEIRDRWTLTELWEAHVVLDALDDASRRAAAKSQHKAS